MRVRWISLRITSASATLLLLFVASAAGQSDVPTPPQPASVVTAGWYAGDLHSHTFLTDGSYSPAAVADSALGRYGLSWMANSEHGGFFARDASGTVHAKAQPRWLTLKTWSYPAVQSIRATYPDRTVIQGLEWNVPTHDHASVGIIADEPDAISDFEYLFDANDVDTSRPGMPKRNKSHADTLAAARWLQTRYPTQSYVVVNHPSRKLAYTAADLRALMDAGPTVVAGFEGMPGHQRRAARGGYYFDYGSKTYLARTYGGADYALAKVGGVWDSLLAEGRQFHVFANSDFHRTTYDFWPGQYAKIWAWMDDPTDPASLVRSMRSGRVFVAHGDLVDGLEFRAAKGLRGTEMGRRALIVSSGDDVVVTVRFHTPTHGAAGNTPAVHHVDLIGSPLRTRAKPGSSAYGASTNTAARILARLSRSQFTAVGGGWYEGHITLKDVARDQYIRLRGTNLAPNTPYETNERGNPMSDSKRGTNTAAKALADLWFYSNPIWIDVR